MLVNCGVNQVINLLSKQYFNVSIYFSTVALLTRIQESEDKGVCTRALWCLAKQNLDSVIINTKVWSNII